MSGLRKDFWREIRKSPSRFISIFLIVALGVAFFSGLRATEPDMRDSGDYLLDQQQLMDLQIQGTLGVTEDDRMAVLAVPGVLAASLDFSQDRIASANDTEYNLRLMKLQDEVSLITLTKGRLPEHADECLADVKLEEGGLSIGDEIVLDPEENDPFAEDHFLIVGFAEHPNYLSFERGNSTAGDGSSDGFLMLPDSAWTEEYYTGLLVRTEGTQELICYSDAYQDQVDVVRDAIEAISEERCDARYQQVHGDAMEEWQDAKDELDQAKADAEEELSDARKELEDGEKDLADGEQEVKDGWEKWEDGKATLEDSRKQLQQAKKDYDSGKAQYEKALKDWEDGMEQVEAGEKECDDNEAALAQQEAQLLAAKEQYDAAAPEREAGLAQLQATIQSLTETKAQLQPLADAGNEQAIAQLRQVEEGLAEANAQYEEIIAQGEQLTAGLQALEAGKQQLAAAREELASSRQALEDGKETLDDTKRQLDDAAKSISDGERELIDGQRELDDSEKELRDAEKELADARKELEDGWKDYEEGKAEADEEIADAEQKLADAKEELDDIPVPEWFITDRMDLETYSEYDRDAANIGALGKVIPVLFFLVATLVSLTTMTRMVEEERILIGTLKALGYSKGAIASKYIKYALFACVSGSILGVLFGEKVLPYVIISTYAILYRSIHHIVFPLRMGYGLFATGIACGCILVAVLGSCWRELRDTPATLMRPEAPKLGKRILLERVTFLWKRLSFTGKATLRNLFRYKKRLLMTVFGVGGCMALLLVGYGIRDSIYVVSQEQYTNLHSYDAMLGLHSQEEGDLEQLEQDARADSMVADAMLVRQEQLSVRNQEKKFSGELFVPDDLERFPSFITLRTRIGHDPISLTEDGVVIAEKLAGKLDVKVGDTIEMEVEENVWKPLTVSGITENYYLNYIYMAPQMYQTLFGEQAEADLLLLNLAEGVDAEDLTLSERLLSRDEVVSFTYVSVFRAQVERMLHNINVIIYVIIIAAGLLAFVVLYNLNYINIKERRRELATLKVLGFTDLEVASYVYRENIILTLLGMVLGLVLGNLLHRYVITTVEVEAIMFGRIIQLPSYLMGTGLTLLFSVIVNVFMFFQLKRIDMVESMKNVE